MQVLRVAGRLLLAVWVLGLAAGDAYGQMCRFFERQKLLATDPDKDDENDHFGGSSAIDGEWLVVGAETTDLWPHRSTGSVFLFRRDGTDTPLDPTDDSWKLEAELIAWDVDGAAGLGVSVSISGDRIVGGAYGDNDACGGAGGCASGSAYVFRYTGTAWVPEQKLVASDQGENKQFGGSVSISGNWVAVGSVVGDGWLPATGVAYLFRLDDNGTPSDPSDDFWIEHRKLRTPEGATDDRFGQTVAIGTDRVIVGAPSLNFSGHGTDPGWAYVFRRDDNGTPSDAGDDTWVYEARLMASDGGEGQFFGRSLAVGGDRVVVGASEDDQIGARSGAAYVFRRDDNGTPSDPGDDVWFEEAKLTTLDQAAFDRVGTSVAISGDRIALGAFRDDTITGNAVGSAYVFRYSGGQWRQEQKLLASEGEWLDEVGKSVAIGGGQVIVGAVDDDDLARNAGAAYVFDLVTDCNGNCIEDQEDVATGASADCNDNGIPDECENDCNSNGLDDACDIDSGASLDCNSNVIPDECEADCNGNDIPDDCDINGGVSEDCNLNGIPDECDPDCNGDSIPDDCIAICTDHCECRDGDACTRDRCIAGTCTNTPSAYGDADDNDTINIFDLLCVLAGFAGDFGTCTFQDDDINPCAGNGTIDIFDLLAVLNAFAGQDPCCAG